MGLFGFIGNVVRDTVKAVGTAVGTVAETVGRALGSTTIENWGANLKARCQFGKTQWNQSSSVQKTVDIHKELEMVKNSVESQARAVESELIEECISEVSEALEALLPLVSSVKLRMLNDSYAEQINLELSDLIMEYINPQLSTDDPRCTKVLNILDDYARMEASRVYQEGVMSDAVRSFKKDCIKIKNRYIHQIVELAEEGLRDQEQECNELDRILTNRLEQTMNEDEIDIAREQILLSIEKLSLLQTINNRL